VRLDVNLGSKIALSQGVYNVTLSPDGTRLVFLSSVGPKGPVRMYARRLDQSTAKELTVVDGPGLPFFSPDGQWVGFFAGNNGTRLNKISVEGGAAIPVGDVAYSNGGSWGSDGSVIVGAELTGCLQRVPANGGAPTTVLDLAPSELGCALPQILPGGKAVLFVDYRTPDGNTANIEVFSFADRRRKTVLRGSDSARYLPSGHLIYARKGTLFAVAFDLDRLETRGPAVAILDDLAYDAQTGADSDDWNFAGNGTFVYRGGGGGSDMRTIQWVDRDGKKEPLRSQPDAYTDVAISPDGKRVSFGITGPTGQDLWVYDLQRDALTRLTFGGVCFSPVWTPDGEFIVFGAIGKGIYWTRADGAGQPQPLIQSKHWQQPFSITGEGKRLAYSESVQNGQIWTVSLQEQSRRLIAGEPEQFLKSEFSDFHPAFSPDGRWLAYTSNESGKDEVYVRPFPSPASGAGGKWQISSSGGRLPIWSQTKRELLYETGRNLDQLMTVSYAVNGDSFVAEKPTVWNQNLSGLDIDLAPDGKRVAVVTPLDTPDAQKDGHEMTFLFNFFDELRRRVPVAGK
jgi:serine/threonine-protein kinase